MGPFGREHDHRPAREQPCLRRKLATPIDDDLQRLTGRLNLGSATPRDLIALRTSLERVPEIRQLLRNAESSLLQVLNESLDELRETRSEGGDVEALRGRLNEAQNNFKEKLSEVDAELAGLAREWDAALDANADDATRSALLARMNEILNRRSYIRNLVVSVQKELE